jgi:hypothetical protein
MIRFSMKKFSRSLFAIICLLAVSSAYSQSTYTVTKCSGEDLHFQHPGHISGETYSWSLPVITPGSGALSGYSTGVGQSELFQTLTNTITDPVVATYSVTTSENVVFYLRVTINPAASIGNVTVPVCSGSSFTYSPVSVPANTRYTWVVSSISPPGSVTGSGDETNPQVFIGGQTLFNPSVNPATVVYTVTPKSGACPGASFLLTATVNPLPVLNNQSLAPVAQCSGQTYTYSPASTTPGTSIIWSRAAVTGMANTGNAGAGNPNEVLVNNTQSPVVAL